MARVCARKSLSTGNVLAATAPLPTSPTRGEEFVQCVERYRRSVHVNPHGQEGLSRLTLPSFMKSSFGRPMVWVTCGMTLMTLL